MPALTGRRPKYRTENGKGIMNKAEGRKGKAEGRRLKKETSYLKIWRFEDEKINRF